MVLDGQVNAYSVGGDTRNARAQKTWAETGA